VTAHRVLLVGGQAEFIERKVVPRLQSLVAPDGAPVRVPRHVAWKTDRFPTDYVRADAIMVVTDMVSHTLSDAARDHARRLAVPYVPISRKWLESAATLTRYGYRTPVPEASAPPAAAPVEAAPTTPEVPMPRTHVPRETTLREVIEVLARDPSTTNAVLAAKCGDHARPVMPEARKRLGIVAPRHGSPNRTVALDTVRFLAACNDYSIPDEIASAALARFPSIGEAATTTREYKAALTAAPPKAAPRPAPPSPLDTLREAVALLRVAMADAGIVSLSVERDGSVKCEQITTLRL
jgi:hypothetical protein